MSRIIINKNKCKACYLCLDICPKHLIKKGNFANSKGEFPVEFSDDNSECIACAMCAKRCPHLAIEKVIKE